MSAPWEGLPPCRRRLPPPPRCRRHLLSRPFPALVPSLLCPL